MNLEFGEIRKLESYVDVPRHSPGPALILLCLTDPDELACTIQSKYPFITSVIGASGNKLVVADDDENFYTIRIPTLPPLTYTQLFTIVNPLDLYVILEPVASGAKEEIAAITEACGPHLEHWKSPKPVDKPVNFAIISDAILTPSYASIRVRRALFGY